MHLDLRLLSNIGIVRILEDDVDEESVASLVSILRLVVHTLAHEESTVLYPLARVSREHLRVVMEPLAIHHWVLLGYL